MTESRTLACSSGRDMFLRGSNAAMLYVLRDRERAHIYGFLMGLLCEGSLRFWVWGSTMLISVFRCAVFSATAAPAHSQAQHPGCRGASGVRGGAPLV